ncbi:hypothetical protein PMAYCL1PPCAC_26251, partial [Pristionchus mayeri]
MGHHLFRIINSTIKANLANLKCDMLLYRSLVMGNQCFFAINKKMTFSAGAKECASIMPNAQIHTINTQTSDSVLQTVMAKMHLNGGDYHVETTSSYVEKGVICRYVDPVSCRAEERSELPGRCMKSFDQKLTFVDAFDLRGSILPRIYNNDDSKAVAKLIGSSPAPVWINHAGSREHGGWREDNFNKAKYFNWFFGRNALDFQCRPDFKLAATLWASMKIGMCLNYGAWTPAEQTDRHNVICVRPADSDFNPPRWNLSAHPSTTTKGFEWPSPPTTTRRWEWPDPPTTTTRRRPGCRTKKTTKKRPDWPGSSEEWPPKRTTKTTTTTTTKYVPPEPVYPRNDPPNPAWFWTMRYYYNWGRILHAFCAPEEQLGCSQMFNNGIGYDRNAGTGESGKTISEAGYYQMKTVCADNHMHLRRLHFHRVGNHYQHHLVVTANGGIFMGYVAVQQGTC